jgi:hypothetical protein
MKILHIATCATLVAWSRATAPSCDIARAGQAGTTNPPIPGAENRRLVRRLMQHK